MEELSPRDRLQPFLLDRLMDDQADQGKESRDKYVMSPRQLKAALLRDLTWLLNSPAPTEWEGIAESPNIATSVINYGIPDLTGATHSSRPGAALEKSILRAIQAFEPRLDKQSLSVRLAEHEDTQGPNALTLEIRGQVQANPLPDAMYIRTDVDLETGQFALKDRPNG